MIAYLYLKSNNQITSIVEDLVSIADKDVIGTSSYAKGNDFTLLEVFCSETVITKTVDEEELPLEIGDTFDVGELTNHKEQYLLQNVRDTRNALLTQCDWTQLPNSPLSAIQVEAYAVYRQELRDFPSVVDLDNIVYPVAPTI